MTERKYEPIYSVATRMALWFMTMALLGFLVGMLTGCNADCASPFEKPDATTQPVECQAEGCAS